LIHFYKRYIAVVILDKEMVYTDYRQME